MRNESSPIFSMVAAPVHSTRTCTVTVPATSANLGPGFDCLGLALELRNKLILTFSGPDLPFDGNTTAYSVHVAGVDKDKVPLDQSNLAIQAAEMLFRQLNCRPSAIEMRIENCIPVGSGLGSSSSAIIAGLVGANTLYDEAISRNELLRIAVLMEGHPDNVAPAMLGGLVLGVLPDEMNGPDELIVHRWDPPRLSAVVVLPDFFLLTSEARAVLPPVVSRSDAIFNTSRLALLIEALTTGRNQLLKVAMADKLHQSHRLNIIPGAMAAFEAAYHAGAEGVALSGAGPSLIAFSTGDPSSIAGSMVHAFLSAGLKSRVWVLETADRGVTITN